MVWHVRLMALFAVSGVTAEVTIKNGCGRVQIIFINLKMLQPDYTWMEWGQLPMERICASGQSVQAITSSGRL